LVEKPAIRKKQEAAESCIDQSCVRAGTFYDHDFNQLL